MNGEGLCHTCLESIILCEGGSTAIAAKTLPSGTAAVVRGEGMFPAL